VKKKMGSISSPDTATTPGSDAHLLALPGDRDKISRIDTGQA
jgi:hypothetical protein